MARAIAKHIRMSPRKLRRVINVIRGKDTTSAQTVLKFMPYAGARIVEKVLKSAVSNAKENESLSPDELRITKAYVDQSTTLRRWRAMSRGRGYPILKRTSHVTIEVNSDPSLATAHKTPKLEKGIKVRHKDAHDHTHEHKHGHEHAHEHTHEHKAKQPTKKAPKIDHPDMKEEKTKKIKEKAKDAKKKKEDKDSEGGGKK